MDTRPEELEKDCENSRPQVSGTDAIHTLRPSTAAGINQPEGVNFEAKRAQRVLNLLLQFQGLAAP